MSKNYEATETGFREVEDKTKDKAADTEGVTPEKKDVQIAKEKKKTKTKAKKGSKSKKTKVQKASTEKLELENNLHIPYPELGGHTVSALSQMETHKRKSILGEKDADFVKKYLS